MLKENFCEDGYWWFPPNPDQKYPGVLKYVVDYGISLEISEIDAHLPTIRQSDNVPVIYGVTSSGRLATLINSFDNGSSWSSSGISKRKLSPAVAFVGNHIPIDGQVFRACYFHLSHANKWLRNSGIEIVHKDAFSGLDIQYRKPPKIESWVGDKFKLGIIRNLASIPIGLFDLEEIQIKENVWFEIRPPNPMPLDFFLENVAILRDLLTIACDAVCETTAMDLECNLVGGLLNDTEKYPTVKLLANQPTYKSRNEPVDSREFLFIYPDVKDNFESVINKWYEAQDKLRVVKDLYISSLYSPFNYIETKFLSLSQACEVFHRRFFSGQYLLCNDFEERVQKPLVAAIPAGLDASYKDSLKTRIAYFNEYSLSKRMKDITKEYGTVLAVCFGDTKVISANIVSARNHLTHYTELTQDANFFNDIMKYTDYLKFVLDIAFLKVLGLSEGKILELVERNHAYVNRLKYI